MKRIIFVALISCLFVSCYYDKADVINPNAAFVGCDTTSVSYSATVAPIIATYCAQNSGCHGANPESIGGKLTLNDYTSLSTYVKSNKDIFLRDINWTSSNASNNMPQSASKLSDCNLNKLSAWINQGAKNN